MIFDFMSLDLLGWLSLVMLTHFSMSRNTHRLNSSQQYSLNKL